MGASIMAVMALTTTSPAPNDYQIDALSNCQMMDGRVEID